MEARALYNFKATSTDELSFCKGDLIKITGEEDKHWLKAEMNGVDGVVPSNHLRFIRAHWYVNTSKEDCMELLKEKKGTQLLHPEGTFLVRPSQSAPGEMSLSVRIKNDVQHYKILRSDHPRKDKYYLWSDADMFKTINDLVAFYRSHSVSKTDHVLLRDMKTARYKALYEFKSRADEELDLTKGEIVTVIDRRDPDWWLGQIERDTKSGTQSVRGLIPATYVTPSNE